MQWSLTADNDARLTTYGEGPPLVLMPGMDGNGELFYRQIPGLSATHGVCTYRLRDEARSVRR